jgi:hypothetical protein
LTSRRGAEMDTTSFQRARLIPVSGIKGDQEQERRATSALLAVIEAVPEFGRSILKPLGAPSGRVTAFIEPEFTLGDRKVRPDGLLVVERGKTTWSVAVEVKTGRNDLVAEQINSYIDVCRETGIDALLTISNQVLTLSGAHPTAGIDLRRLKKTSLAHYSWMRVLTEAQIQKEHRGVSDPDQAWILGELIRYLQTPASGALEFDDMGESWVSVRRAAMTGTLSAADPGVIEIAQRFESLLRFTSFKLSVRLGVEVEPVAGKLAKSDPVKHLKETCRMLVQDAALRGSIRVQDTIAPLEITVDIRAGQILTSIIVDAPKEGRAQTRVNWLLRQLKKSPPGLRIETRVKRAATAAAACLLSDAIDKPELLVPSDGKEISQFIITMISPMGTKRGTGRNSFVDSFLAAIDAAYQGVLENLHPWAPKAPRLPKGSVEVNAENHPAPVEMRHNQEAPAATQTSPPDTSRHTDLIEATQQ